MKLAVLSAADKSGISRFALSTGWRQQKLLILCYHGISLEDEHTWDTGLYMSSDLLRSRFAYLRKSGCTVLPLDQAITALYQGNLPPRAVAITFDDGFYDFYKRALPVAQEFQFPLTVYLTTYYSYFNHPVFDPTLNYLLWKGIGKRLRLPEALPDPVLIDDTNRRLLGEQLYQHVIQQHYSGADKNVFLRQLAESLGIDFDSFCDKRLLHLMTPAEVDTVTAAGADVQLHTHRHRVSSGKPQFQGEILENREKVEAITQRAAQHFCYPSGFFLADYPNWLQEINIRSATTCIPGIATSSTSPFLLPRLVDTSTVTETEFGGWVTGLASLLPQRKFVMDDRSYLKSEN